MAAGNVRVVVPNHAHVLGHPQPMLAEHVERTNGRYVVGDEHCRRPLAGVEQLPHPLHTGILRVGAGNAADLGREPMAAHRPLVAGATGVGPGTAPPMDVGDLAMAEAHQVVDNQLPAKTIVVGNTVDLS